MLTNLYKSIPKSPIQRATTINRGERETVRERELLRNSSLIGMATSKGYFARPSYRFLPGDRDYGPTLAHDSAFELDESDIYNSGRANSSEFRKPVTGYGKKSSSSSSTSLKRVDSGDRVSVGGTQASLPVNVPDWSKILRNEYRENKRKDSIDDYDDDDVDSDDGCDGETRVPPHEFLARTRIASFSVQEGAGRTLKGRDLSRVRNAIWAKTGFQD
ncbi:Senescence regulator [Quillaja saponaria]|uniref:Senescence regulator n=1 Tax=Quillaja saponaria TaxID=32244 RepID=A0AAD7QGB7_QUISA|nr:Senescence regulator [Quillaja saponaria]